MMGAPFQPFPDPGKKRGVISKLGSKILKVLLRGDVTTYPQLSGKNTSELGAGEAAFSSFSSTYWKIGWDRRAVYSDLREMDSSDPLISTALDIIADCATGYEDTSVDSFEWLMDRNDDQAKAAMVILNEMKLRLELGAECWQIVRGFVRNGEEFREVVWDESGIARRLKHLPSYQISPMLDGFGNKQPGYQQRLDGAQYGKPIDFPEWGMISFVYGARRGWQGTGLMMPARRTWKRLVKMEDGMALARLIRAYDKYLHKVPVKPEWDLDRNIRAITEHKRQMTKRYGLDENNQLFTRERPFQVETDIYLPDDGSGKGRVELLSAQNQQLMNVDDVLYNQALLMARLKVPSKYLNLVRRSGALTDAGLSAEDIQFARTLRQVQAVLRTGLLKLAHYQLAFQGWDSDELGVGLNLPKVSTDDQYQDAKVLFTMAQAADLFAQVLGGLPPELVATMFMKLKSDQQEVLMEWVKENEEEQEELRRQMAMAGKLVPEFAAGAGGTGTPSRRGGDGRFRVNVNGKLSSGKGGNTDDAGEAGTDSGPEDQGVPAGLLVSTLTDLQMLVQSELENQGQSFRIGRAERLHRTREALFERISEQRNGFQL